MTPDEFRAELEEELRWRQEELAFFKNQLVDIVLENDADRYRKSLVLILYSHFEGYVKIALQTYIEYLNSLCVLQKDVVPALAASGMHKEFIAYENLRFSKRRFRKIPLSTGFTDAWISLSK